MMNWEGHSITGITTQAQKKYVYFYKNLSQFHFNESVVDRKHTVMKVWATQKGENKRIWITKICKLQSNIL
jgi:hypothetical protein